MTRSTLLFRFAATLLVVMCANGCAAPDSGWQRLWHSEWALHNSGDRWVLGVPASNRTLKSSGSGNELRVELVNTGGESAVVELRGAGVDLDWTLDPAEHRVIAMEIGGGDCRIDGPTSVILGSPRIGRPSAEPRLLVVVLVDTLRADHVNPDLMPGVTEFFADGRKWQAAAANAPWTLPSVASLFTSRPVLELTSPNGEMVGLPDGLATWATALHNAGFEGGAAVANYTVHALNGFAGGFSSFRVPDGHGEEIAPDAAWVAEEARRWLASHRGEDAFLYLHFMDPHEPYRDHSGAGVDLPPLRPLARRQREATAEEARQLVSRYAGEVRHVDGILARFLGELPDGASVVLTSDHGEGLGEHGAWAHGPSLYQEALSVPLMVRGPEVLRGDVVEPAQLLDLAPTLLDLTGIESPEGMTGRSLLAGGSSEPIVSVTFSAGPLRWAWREANRKVVMRMAPQPGLGAVVRRSVVEAEPLPAGMFLVDLTVDPGEDRPGPIPDVFMHRVTEVFAGTAATMAPGMQIFGWGAGQIEVVLDSDQELELSQAWSFSAMEISHQNGRFTARCAEDGVVCALVATPQSVPAMVTPVETGRRWWGIVAGGPLDPRSLGFPNVGGPGLYVWWNAERPLIVGGYDETLERLRALGYIE